MEAARDVDPVQSISNLQGDDFLLRWWTADRSSGGDDITSCYSNEADAVEDSSWTVACLSSNAWLFCVAQLLSYSLRSILPIFPCFPGFLSELQGSRGPLWCWSWTRHRDVLHRTNFSGNQRNWLGFSQFALLPGILIYLIHCTFRADALLP